MTRSGRATNHTTLRVLVADEHPVYADALRSFIQIDPSIHVVGEAGSAGDLLAAVRRLRPRVAVVEADGVHLRGAELIPELIRNDPGIAVILMATTYLRSNRAWATESGAFGYVDKEYAADHLLDLLWSLLAGQPSPGAPSAAGTSTQPVPGAAPLGLFGTVAVGLLAAGMDKEAIAAALNLPLPSVQTCLRRVMVKLQLSDMAALRDYARNNGYDPG